MQVLNKESRSPLRYPGGKSRGVAGILRFIPEKTRVIYSPFLGGGSVEIACANKGIEVHAYDNFKPLVDFWQYLLRDRKGLVRAIRRNYSPPLSRDQFYEMQKSYSRIKSLCRRAAVFYVLNRASFSGTTLSGGMSPHHPRFTTSSIDRLENFEIDNFHVEHADFKESIKKAGNNLMYLDPPYMLDQRLYGDRGDQHAGFDHEGLAALLRKKKNWILSYNDSDGIRKMYDGYKFHYPKWTYGMSNDKKSREVLVFSDVVAEKNKENL